MKDRYDRALARLDRLESDPILNCDVHLVQCFSLLRALILEKMQGICPICKGNGTFRVKHGVTFETDSAAERAACWHTESCSCGKVSGEALDDFVGDI